MGRPRARAVALAAAGLWARPRSCGAEAPAQLELEDCIASLPECAALLAAGNQTGSTNEEEVAFSILGSWLKGLYMREEEPRLAEDLPFRASVLSRLQQVAHATVAHPQLAIGVGQMLFLYFWWGVHPPPGTGASLAAAAQIAGERIRGPDLAVASAAADLHYGGLLHAGCATAQTAAEDFASRKCPWRWRFVLMLAVEVARKLAVDRFDLRAAAAQLRLAQRHLQAMRELPYFASHRSLALGAPRWANQNDDHLPVATHRPIWPREAWPPLAFFLEENFPIFLAELARIIEADEGDEMFRTVQLQQTEFTALPRDWGLLDLVRLGNKTAACPYAPTSCELLKSRPELDGRCHSERVPNAGVAFARLLPGAEVKPHFATEPRLAVHLGLITPPGASMTVANETVTWEAGRALVFDDTYVHSVRHDGDEPRFIMLAWICHPCDPEWLRGLPPEVAAEHGQHPWCGGGGPAADARG